MSDVNVSEIVTAYQDQRKDDNGNSPRMTPQDMEAAELAAIFPEHMLRQAAVMRAAWVRRQK